MLDRGDRNQTTLRVPVDLLVSCPSLSLSTGVPVLEDREALVLPGVLVTFSSLHGCAKGSLLGSELVLGGV